VNDFLRIMANVSDAVGLLGSLFAFLAWLSLRRQRKALLEAARKTPSFDNFDTMVNYHSKIKTTNPYVLAISLLERSGSIRPDVENFLRTMGPEWEKIPILEIDMNGIDPHKNLKEFIEELRRKRRELDALTATEVHLFVAGPVISSTIIGAELDNWKPVKLYHKNHVTKQYEYWCPLTK